MFKKVLIIIIIIVVLSGSSLAYLNRDLDGPWWQLPQVFLDPVDEDLFVFDESKEEVKDVQTKEEDSVEESQNQSLSVSGEEKVLDSLTRFFDWSKSIGDDSEDFLENYGDITEEEFKSLSNDEFKYFIPEYLFISTLLFTSLDLEDFQILNTLAENGTYTVTVRITYTSSLTAPGHQSTDLKFLIKNIADDWRIVDSYGLLRSLDWEVSEGESDLETWSNFQDRQVNESISRQLSNLRAEAVIFFAENENYQDFCQTDVVISILSGIYNLASEEDVVCNDNPQAWVASAKLTDGDYFCVDYRGFADSVTEPLQEDLSCQ